MRAPRGAFTQNYQTWGTPTCGNSVETYGNRGLKPSPAVKAKVGRGQKATVAIVRDGQLD
jgi:hypothetical protein